MEASRLYDVVIVGGGPAGLTAALYLARACYRVLVVEKETFGGQITLTEEVVNYPGVGRASGKALAETMRKQAEAFGTEFLLAEVTSLDLNGDIKTVVTDKGEYTCFGVLLAVGARPRMIGFPGEAEFRGHGVAYCATCDGEFFTGKDVFVVGGGFAAAEESVFLTKYARHVTILMRKDDFSCAESVARPAKEHPKITVLPNTQVVEAKGDHVLRSLCYRNSKTGEETVFTPENDSFGIFVFAGCAPDTGWLKEQVALDPAGYILTDHNQKTNVDGVFAAGDVCRKNLRQVVTAVGDGALAATELEKYAAAMQAKTGLQPAKPVRKEAEAEKTPSSAPVEPAKAQNGSSGLFDPGVLEQLSTVFARMESPLILSLHLDQRPVSAELKAYMEELAKQTDKLSVKITEAQGDGQRDSAESREEGGKSAAALPVVRVLRADGTETGMAFHGVPGGHEFTSFVLGLYNAAGPGQPLGENERKQIEAIDKPLHLQILVSLSCTMCPELVTAAQRIASLNPRVTAEVYDLNHFPELKEEYQVMSVPCLVVNSGEKVLFGKKNIPQLLQELK